MTPAVENVKSNLIKKWTFFSIIISGGGANLPPHPAPFIAWFETKHIRAGNLEKGTTTKASSILQQQQNQLKFLVKGKWKSVNMYT